MKYLNQGRINVLVGTKHIFSIVEKRLYSGQFMNLGFIGPLWLNF